MQKRHAWSRRVVAMHPCSWRPTENKYQLRWEIRLEYGKVVEEETLNANR